MSKPAPMPTPSMSGGKLSRSLYVLALACLALEGCTARDCTPAPGLAMWVTYTDAHGLGSTARAEEFFGDLVVDLDKAPDSHMVSDRPKYTYSGIMIFAAPNQSGINVSDIEALKIEYSSTSALNLLLEQPSIPRGEDFRTTLAATNSPQTANFKIDQSTFFQPQWVQKLTSLLAHRLVAIKFELQGPSRASTHLIIRNVSIEGRDVCIQRQPY